MFRQKIRDQPSDDLEAGERGIAAFCLEQRNVDVVAAEVVQFMALVRQVLKFFPLTLIRPRAPEQRSLHWHALRLGAIFLEVDHQVRKRASNYLPTYMAFSHRFHSQLLDSSLSLSSFRFATRTLRGADAGDLGRCLRLLCRRLLRTAGRVHSGH